MVKVVNELKGVKHGSLEPSKIVDALPVYRQVEIVELLPGAG